MSIILQWVGLGALILITVSYLVFIPYMLIDIYNSIYKMNKKIKKIADKSDVSKGDDEL